MRRVRREWQDELEHRSGTRLFESSVSLYYSSSCGSRQSLCSGIARQRETGRDDVLSIDFLNNITANQKWKRRKTLVDKKLAKEADLYEGPGKPCDKGGATIVSLSQIQGPQTPEKNVQRRTILNEMT